MPQDLADALYTHLLDRFPADRDYPRGALYVEGMPPLVASLLGRTLDRWLEHELDALESRWFDFNDPGVRAARAELVVALGRTARVPRGAWAETLRYAVGLTVRHLATPARALTDATFEGQPEALPTDTVRSRLHTFEAYPYLPEIADAYLAQKRPETVDPDTLHGLLLRIDRRVTADYAVEDWSRLLSPLFKLSRHVPEVKGVPASLLADFFSSKGVDAVAEALRQRGDRTLESTGLREILEKHVAHHAPAGAEPDGGPQAEPAVEEVEEVSPEEVADRHAAPAPSTADHEEEVEEQVEEQVEELVDGKEEVSEAVVRQAAPEPAPETDTVAAPPVTEDQDTAEPGESRPAEHAEEPEEADAPVIGGAVSKAPLGREVAHPGAPEIVPPAGDDEEDQPLWKRFASGAGGPTMETAIPDDSVLPQRSESHPPFQSEKRDASPIWKRFISGLKGSGEVDTTAGSAPAGPGTPEIDALEERVLGRADHRLRRRYVRDLFGGDDQAYVAVLQQVDRSETWSDASQIIARNVFRRYSVDIYSPTAVSFTDAVNATFQK